MKILPNIEIIDLALKIGDSLIIADTHIGYEEAINKQGILIPRFQFNEIIERLRNIFKVSGEINRFVINGDVKHEFGAISQTEWRHTLALLEFIEGYCNEIVIVRGNHDRIIGPIAKKMNVRILEHLIIQHKKQRFLILHGDKMPKKLPRYDVIIIGHQHPAISLRDGVKTELYKCFLRGKYKNAKLIVLPSFCLVTEGTDILKGEILTDFLRQPLKNFNIYIVADKVYNFGRLLNLSFRG